MCVHRHPTPTVVVAPKSKWLCLHTAAKAGARNIQPVQHKQSIYLSCVVSDDEHKFNGKPLLKQYQLNSRDIKTMQRNEM